MMNSKKKTIILSIISIILVLIAIGLGYYYLMSSKPISIPDFSSMKEEEIVKWLEENKLDEKKYELVYEYSEDIEKGKLISQSINEGSKLKKEEILKIVISDGIDPKKEIEIPDFKGKSVAEITKWFEENHFTNMKVEYEPSLDYKKDEFIKLSVNNKLQARDSEIKVIISSGDEEITEIEIIDFKNYSKENIEAWVKKNKLRVKFITAPSDTIKKGAFLSQNPKAGTTIKINSTITITYSSGKGLEAKSFAGKPVSEAKEWIKQNGLKEKYVYLYDKDYKENIIINNTPSKGSISTNSLVTFNVSLGLVPIENYTNKKINEFESYINNLNSTYSYSAKIRISKKEVESSETNGKILGLYYNNQKISKTTYVAPSSIITVEVAIDKKIEVIDKSGVLESDFKNYILGLSLKLGNRKEMYSETIGSGKIISNDTGKFSKDSLINYIVSKGKYTIDIASFTNKPYIEIVKEVENAKTNGKIFTLNRTESYSDSIVKDNIISCSINGSTINCNVSKGKDILAINLLNKNWDEVCGMQKDSCEYNGFIVKRTIKTSDTYEYGVIFEQSPNPNESMNGSNVINVSVSNKQKINYCQIPSALIDFSESYGGYDQAVTMVRNQLSGFSEVKIVTLTGSDNPDNYDGIIKSINPSTFDTDIDCNNTITVEIYKKNN